MRCGVGIVCLQGLGQFQRQLGRFKLLADFGAHAHQVAQGGRGMALTKTQAHAALRRLGNGNAVAMGIQANDVANPGVGRELARPVQQALVLRLLRLAQTHQRAPDFGQCSLGLIERDLQGLEHQLQRWLAVQLGDHMALAGRNLVLG